MFFECNKCHKKNVKTEFYKKSGTNNMYIATCLDCGERDGYNVDDKDLDVFIKSEEFVLASKREKKKTLKDLL